MNAFDAAQRQRVLDLLVERAQADGRIASAAVVGSLAGDGGDRWSDVDLTFGVADGQRAAEVLDDWSRYMRGELEADTLIDLASGDATYRVFLLDGGLQVDLSFVPRPDARQAGSRFRLLFGSAARADPPPADTAQLLGWAVIYVRHARVCIERGRWWQAAHCLAEARANAMAIACVGRGLSASFGRGFDDLPADVRARFEPTLVGELSAGALVASLGHVAAAVVAVAEPAVGGSARLAARVNQLVR